MPHRPISLAEHRDRRRRRHHAHFARAKLIEIHNMIVTENVQRSARPRAARSRPCRRRSPRRRAVFSTRAGRVRPSCRRKPAVRYAAARRYQALSGRRCRRPRRNVPQIPLPSAAGRRSRAGVRRRARSPRRGRKARSSRPCRLGRLRPIGSRRLPWKSQRQMIHAFSAQRFFSSVFVAGSWMMPRLPVNSPRAATAWMSPNGSTRFCSGISVPSF